MSAGNRRWGCGLDGTLEREIKQRVGVHARAVEFHAPMEMRTSRPAGRADLPHDLPGFHKVSILNQDFGQVEIHRVESESMVKKDALS